ncbi:hypothetical protein CEXT_756221 [Caerostris extrusa]|uniref:Uncharacterized protein n=1 Tax=Caerostris extrusa TaxID=172846 RepID=A0AAV4RLH7_CAEEX|nr:hypothetical protein CEXT_756221 [Caerostris extrusa]
MYKSCLSEIVSMAGNADATDMELWHDVGVRYLSVFRNVVQRLWDQFGYENSVSRRPPNIKTLLVFSIRRRP